jgi:hypothetical protein
MIDKLRHRSYVSIQEVVDGVVIQGPGHHASVVYRKPMVEGKYAFEVVFPHQPAEERRPAIRVGICPARFGCGKPLGATRDSFGYSSEGALIHGGRRRQVEGFSYEDTVTVVLVLDKPLPKPSAQSSEDYRQQANANSSLAFYKNGQLVHEEKGLPMEFFCFGVSLFQKAIARVNLGGPFLYNLGAPAEEARWSEGQSFINQMLREE